MMDADTDNNISSPMPNYRRPHILGGCWFFTVTLQDRRSRILVERIDDLRNAVAVARRRQPFHIDAMVVLPDHIHAIWTLPEGDMDFPERWRRIKAEFTSALVRSGMDVPRGRRPGERALWQRRFWEHAIRDDGDFARHFDYCHINPMKHGLVRRTADWPHSTFHRAVRDGIYAPDWAGEVGHIDGFGER